jgi:hypothetical protein
MKAWRVFEREGEWIALVHAEKASHAKLIAMANYSLDNYLDMRANRFPEMDDKPFNWKDCKEAGFEWTNEGGIPYKPEEFYNDCRCDICEGTVR